MWGGKERDRGIPRRYAIREDGAPGKVRGEVIVEAPVARLVVVVVGTGVRAPPRYSKEA